MFEIHTGDAFDELSSMPSNTATTAVVDYPWDFDFKNGRGVFNYERDTQPDVTPNPMFEMLGDEEFERLLTILSDVVEDGGWLLCMADDRFEAVIREALEDNSDWIRRRNWAWTPEQIGMGYYGRVNHYPIPVATLGETERYVKDRGTLFRAGEARDTDYPTGKPTSLYEELLADPVLPEDGMLIEPFCGSAPGAVVADRRDIDYWGCDVDPEATSAAEERIREENDTTDQNALRVDW